MDDGATGVRESHTAAVVRELCRTLDAERVSYCHWKSNAFLDRTLRAENDLDLLVDRADGDLLVAVLGRLGLKRAVDASSSIPGIVHYYGYDAEADRLVHVHLHHRLIIGDDLTKNYWLPLERALLENTTSVAGIRVPAPELELIALVIRLVLKHATWDAMLARRGRMSPSARVELSFLEERADTDRVGRYVDEYLPTVGRSTFEECRRALDPEAGVLQQLRAGHHLVAAMQPCARRPRATDVSLKLWRRADGIARRILARPPRRKRLVGGGLVLAVVGGDGAGKSSVVAALGEWLSPPFTATTVHLGRPPRSPTRRAAELVAGVSSRVSRRRRGGATRAGDDSGRRSPNPWAAVALARDRFRTARDARRHASMGAIVICDRYPLPGLLSSMDAPRLRQATTSRSRLARWLARREQRYYRALTPPDLLVVLRVDPEVAVVRKPEEPADFLRVRWSEIWAADWSALDAHVVDAGRPFAEVLGEVKALVWSHL